ncbi:Enoyl-CoA hydratase/isomerase [Gordonia bronchialis DSM 43247]|uniref:Enoyl-CoA hydratase/isomerase n=1 Tax=Gordonia bronchialis (strain ATCC 25592 / DSM 43247 / BCRC 13721 / JCM 3198 / KCTC 3076 / NBRC 16047 / NCTC 10667) TaxID=526226 RepID=D0LBU9_GORB4|nr:Enoyl-CoA hydratase/isomerase [Gordonia bronchialis DSM 43247]STQ65262.1 1,4-Dihydroxy-2-naphthoyl-CoA synthase [Gordonia bronchialis]
MSDGAVTDDVIESGVGVAVDDRGVGRLTISRPERMNALDTGATVAIIDTLAAWSARDDIRAVVIDGAGGSFSTGADVISIAENAAKNAASGTSGLTSEQARQTISAGSELARAVRGVPVPVIASVDGAAVGIGASLAFASDLVYVTSRSYFLLAFINIGLMPDGAASMSAAVSVGRARANAMALLGEKLRAADAFTAGLVTAVVDDREALDAVVDKAAGKIASSSPAAMRLTKSALDAHTMAGFEAALERELDGQTELLQSPEFQAALAAFTGG